MDVFINDFITCGIRKHQNDQTLIGDCYIETMILKTLMVIYGEISIVNPFTIQNSNSFNENLKVFNFPETEIEKLKKYMEEYSLFYRLNENVAESVMPKTDLINLMMRILIEMIYYKNKMKPISEAEIKIYDQVFYFEIEPYKTFNNIINKNPDEPRILWNRKKNIMRNKIIFEEIKIDYLDERVYTKFGYSLKDIYNMSKQEINEINTRIVDYYGIDAKEGITSEIKNEILKLAFPNRVTTGNGYVDAVLLAAIIATGVMIGMIVSVVVR